MSNSFFNFEHIVWIFERRSASVSTSCSHYVSFRDFGTKRVDRSFWLVISSMDRWQSALNIYGISRRFPLSDEKSPLSKQEKPLVNSRLVHRTRSYILFLGNYSIVSVGVSFNKKQNFTFEFFRQLRLAWRGGLRKIWLHKYITTLATMVRHTH